MSFKYEPTYQFGLENVNYRKLTDQFVSEVNCDKHSLLIIKREGLKLLAQEAFADTSFFLRESHLAALRRELDDPEASDNDKFVIYTHLRNAVVSAHGVLPLCQDTGTAIVLGKKGQFVLTDFDEEEAISEGIYETFHNKNLRYSQIAPLSMFEERNTRGNLPGQIDLQSCTGDQYKFVFIAKGGGSANKTFLYQSAPSILTEERLAEFIRDKLKDLGTSACPPYHLAIVIGGTSAEINLKNVKLASAGYFDHLPTSGSEGGRAFRDLEWEAKISQFANKLGIGAQFGGKYFAHDVRVVRMCRHAASCPIGLGVSCSADRNIVGKITRDGIFLEALEKNPARFLPSQSPDMSTPVDIDLNQGIDKIRNLLSKFPIKTRLNLNGTIIVARDLAHRYICEKIERGEPMPDYFKNYPVYYAGPAKTPHGMASGSFGPTTAGRMDSYVEKFQSLGGSLVMIAKGNRSKSVVDSCKKHGGFYLGSIGGPAAILAQESITKVEILDFEELGMEAVRKIEVCNFPAFILIDDKGNDFFAQF